MAPVATYLRLQGITIFPYIDDWLIVAISCHEAARATQFILDTLRDLGLKVNLAKSHLEPSQTAMYIRAYFDALQARAFIPQERITKLGRATQPFWPLASVSAHQVQHLLGLMASTTAVIQHARLKMRSLQSWYLSLLDPMIDHPSKCLTVTPELTCQLTWWTSLLHLLVGRPFQPLQLMIQVLSLIHI